MRIRSKKGFTLLELLVVVVIVAVLAAAAVPIYLNYVKDSRRAEAKGGLGAIQTAEQVALQRSGVSPPVYVAAADATISTTLNVDLSDPRQNWKFDVTGASAAGYTADAVGRAGTPAAGLHVQLVYVGGAGGSVTVTDVS